jgi:hypothetical protein
MVLVTYGTVLILASLMIYYNNAFNMLQNTSLATQVPQKPKKRLNLTPALKLPKKTKAVTVSEMYTSFVEALLKEDDTLYKKKVQSRRYVVYRMETQYDHRSGKRTHEAPIPVITYEWFKDAIKTFFFESRKFICDGGVLYLGPKMGCIAGRRIENNFMKMKIKSKIDWKKTMSGPVDPETGRRKAIYRPVEETYCRVGWEKAKELKNSPIAEFIPTRSNTENTKDPDKIGFANMFSANLITNPAIQLVYRFYEIQ